MPPRRVKQEKKDRWGKDTAGAATVTTGVTSAAKTKAATAAAPKQQQQRTAEGKKQTSVQLTRGAAKNLPLLLREGREACMQVLDVRRYVADAAYSTATGMDASVGDEAGLVDPDVFDLVLGDGKQSCSCLLHIKHRRLVHTGALQP